MSQNPTRSIAGETLAYFHERIREVLNSDDVAVLAMGDFNDEPFNRSLIDYAQSNRLRAKVTRARSAAFLNLMWSVMGQGIGTHYYDNIPDVLDQFLLTKGLVTGNSGIQADLNSVEIIRFPEMVSGGTYPAPFATDEVHPSIPTGSATTTLSPAACGSKSPHPRALLPFQLSPLVKGRASPLPWDGESQVPSPLPRGKVRTGG